ncbi:hypothetical protein [Dyadobacter frigoris]|uniref:hypothetical protein n=1 Tax=Dyadobacter frigoris TaxID=2576211 RepID=UPI001485A7E3|nr:hypothetical protein [Dyadobacter frigoris]GLU53476.1 hypothetical protein Dfri01_29370 [Dyadobacter frigoris]
MQTSNDPRNSPVLHYVIVTEKMVWQFYYDEYGSKHFRELLGDEARKFIESIPVETNKD